jgi:hypothetical protein
MRAATGRLVSTLAAFAGFSFLLHFAWEMLQSSFYADLPDSPHAQAVWICTRAALGDAAMALGAYASAALVQRQPWWILQPRSHGWTGYLLTGVALTLVLEHLATGALGRWSYGPRMLTLPGLHIGLAPLLQWLLIPPLAVWLTARHVRGGLT